MKFVVIAYLLNSPNFMKEHDTYEEGFSTYMSMYMREDCHYVELKAVSESLIHNIDKNIKKYVVSYLDFGCECEQSFLTIEEANEFMSEYSYKYDNMKLEEEE